MKPEQIEKLKQVITPIAKRINEIFIELSGEQEHGFLIALYANKAECKQVADSEEEAARASVRLTNEMMPLAKCISALIKNETNGVGGYVFVINCWGACLYSKRSGVDMTFDEAISAHEETFNPLGSILNTLKSILSDKPEDRLQLN